MSRFSKRSWEKEQAVSRLWSALQGSW